MADIPDRIVLRRHRDRAVLETSGKVSIIAR
jgi:hypothetical protein